MSILSTEIKPFEATAFHNGEIIDVTDQDLHGQWSVVFFYPADFTFVCPTELGDLADNYAEFKRLGVEIYSVSTDTHFVHKAWHAASETIGKIQYPMIGDPTGTRNCSPWSGIFRTSGSMVSTGWNETHHPPGHSVCAGNPYAAPSAPGPHHPAGVCRSPAALQSRLPGG
jgi:peroxiredoxin